MLTVTVIFQNNFTLTFIYILKINISIKISVNKPVEPKQ